MRAQEAGVLLPGEAEQWWDHLSAVQQAGDFLAGFTAFIVAGTKDAAAP